MPSPLENSSFTAAALCVCRLRGGSISSPWTWTTSQQAPQEMHPYRCTLCAHLIQGFGSINHIGPPTVVLQPQISSHAQALIRLSKAALPHAVHGTQPVIWILNDCPRMPEDNLLLNGIIGAAAGGVATLVRTPHLPPLCQPAIVIRTCRRSLTPSTPLKRGSKPTTVVVQASPSSE